MQLTKSQALTARNAAWIPGGLSSINRKTDPDISFVRGAGSRLWDADGNEYIDYHGAFAPCILGHNDPDVNGAVQDAMAAGQSLFGAGTTAEEGQLAEMFLRSVPWAERVQFFNSGSEATAQALRVARAATGREHVIIVQGSYNGHHNMVAANLMTPAAALGGAKKVGDEYPVVPITAGIPAAELALIHPVPFNDLAAVKTVAERYPIAAMITEPVLQNIGIVKPQPGYLQGLRELADGHGFLLVFDEVKTGFRAKLGGYQAVCGVTPDLATYGKALANGYPIAAMAGKAQYLELTISGDPARRVLLAGTYNCHPLPVAAAIATLSKLRDDEFDVYSHIDRLSIRLTEGQTRLCSKFGLRAIGCRQGSASCLYFADREPTCWWDILTLHDHDLDRRLRLGLLSRGSYFFPVPCKQVSISYAHTVADIDATLKHTEQALQEMTQA